MATNKTGASPDELAAKVSDDLRKYGDALIPGAYLQLGKLWANIGLMSDPDRAAEVERRLGEPYAARFKNPEYVEEGTPLTRTIGRQSDRLKAGAAEKIAEQLSARMSGKSSPQVAREVTAYLGIRAANQHLVTPHSAPKSEQRVREIVGREFPMSAEGLDRLVADHGPLLGRMTDDRQVVLHVARTLRSPLAAQR